MRSKPSEIRGVPTLLRTVTRWAVVAVASAALVGQLTGVKLITPAYADGIPSPRDCEAFAKLFCDFLGLTEEFPLCVGQITRECQQAT